MSEKKDFNPWNFMVSYVDNRKINYMNKPEWEQLFIYIWIKTQFNKPLIQIETKEMYEIAEKFNLEFKQVTTLIKKCNKIDGENTMKTLTFKELIDNNAISNITPAGNLTVRIKLLNSLVYEEVQKILNLNGIYSDTSFSKDILTMPTEGFCKLITGKENFNLKEKSMASVKSLCNKLRLFFLSKNKKSEDLSDEILTQLKTLETVKDIKSLFTIAKTLIDLANPMKSLISSFTFKAVTESIDEIDFSNLVTDFNIC